MYLAMAGSVSADQGSNPVWGFSFTPPTGWNHRADANGAMPNVDGVAPALNDRVLVNDDGTATGADRGLYYVSALGDVSNPWTLTRTTDADSDAEVTSGMVVWISEGTTHGNTRWYLSTADPITLNTTVLSFVLDFVGEYAEGDGINIASGVI